MAVPSISSGGGSAAPPLSCALASASDSALSSASHLRSAAVSCTTRPTPTPKVTTAMDRIIVAVAIPASAWAEMRGGGKVGLVIGLATRPTGGTNDAFVALAPVGREHTTVTPSASTPALAAAYVTNMSVAYSSGLTSTASSMADVKFEAAVSTSVESAASTAAASGASQGSEEKEEASENVTGTSMTTSSLIAVGVGSEALAAGMLEAHAVAAALQLASGELLFIEALRSKKDVGPTAEPFTEALFTMRTLNVEFG